MIKMKAKIPPTIHMRGIVLLFLSLCAFAQSGRQQLGGQLVYNGKAFQVDLTWTQSTSPSITSNKVYRSNVSRQETLLFACSTACTSYVDLAIGRGTRYFYEVTAVNSSGESAKSNEFSVTIP